MRRILITVSLLAAIGLLTCSAAAYFLLRHEPFLKHAASRLVHASTGRELRIDGHLRLDLGAQSRLEAERLVLREPAWFGDEEMVRVERLVLALETASLWRGPLHFGSISIRGCTIRLRENTAGGVNWGADPTVQRATGGEDALAGIPVDTLELDACQVQHHSPRRSEPLIVDVRALSLQQVAGAMANITVSGRVHEQPFALEGAFGPLTAVLEGGRSQHELRLELGEIRFDSKGSFAELRTGAGANLEVRFAGPEFRQVTEYLALPTVSTGPFDFVLGMDSRDGTTRLDVRGDLGTLEVNGAGELDRLVRPTSGQLLFTARGPDLASLGAAIGRPGLAAAPFDLELKAAFEPAGISLQRVVLVTPADRIEVSGRLGAPPQLAQSHLEFTARVDDIAHWRELLGLKYEALGPGQTRGSLESDAEGRFSAKADVEAVSARLNFEGHLGTRAGGLRPDLRIQLVAPDAHRVGTVLGRDNWPAVAAELDGRVARAGDAWRFDPLVLKLGEVEAQLNGRWRHTGSSLDGTDLEARLTVPSLARAGQWLHQPEWPDEALSVGGTLKGQDAGVVFAVRETASDRFELSVAGTIPDLRDPARLDANFDLRLPQLRLLSGRRFGQGLADQPFDLRGHLRLHEDATRLDRVEFMLGTTRGTVNGSLAGGASLVGSALELDLRSDDLRDWLPAPQLPEERVPLHLTGRWMRAPSGDRLENVRAQAGTTLLELSGEFDTLFAAQDLAVRLSLNSPDGTVVRWFTPRPFAPLPLTAQAAFTVSGARLLVEPFELRWGSSDLRGRGQAEAEEGSRMQLTGEVSSQLLDWNELTGWVEEAEPETAGRDAASRMFGDTRLTGWQDLPFDLRAEVAVAHARAGVRQLRDIEFLLASSQDSARIENFSARDLTGGALAGSLKLQASGGSQEAVLDLRGEALRMSLAAFTGQDPATIPPLDLILQLSGVGNTPHEFAGSLDGTVGAFFGAGEINARGLDRVLADFVVHLFRQLEPSVDDQEYTRLDCAAFAAQARAGRVGVDPLLVLTRQVSILSRGAVDLGAEKIDLSFNSQARQGLGLSASILINPFVKVGGTLVEPTIELDPAGAVIQGGAALATGGLSLLFKPVSDRLLGSRDPCGQARREVMEFAGQR